MVASGNITVKKFKLPQNSQKTPLPWILEKLQKNIIAPLEIEDAREQASGFCHPHSGESHIEDWHSLIYDNALLFAIRMDSKKIPSTYFKLQLKNTLEALGHSTQDSGENEGKKRRIPKKLKDSVKDRLKEELLKNTLPSIRIVEVLWHLNKNEIWLFSTSTTIINEFEKLFFEAFETSLIHINAGTMGIDFERLQLNLDVSLQPLLDMVPISFFQEKMILHKERNIK